MIDPSVRFRGVPGEQAAMFFLDRSGNALELGAMREPVIHSGASRTGVIPGAGPAGAVFMGPGSSPG